MSEELKPSAEAERRMRLEDLTKNLPPLPDIPWVWTDEETEMLRAACAKRFGESVRTETLFAIAATGIRIYMSRATITTDNTKAAAELTIKLRDANALIDTLVEALGKIKGRSKEQTVMGEAAKKNDLWLTLVTVESFCREALAEAKKYK